MSGEALWVPGKVLDRKPEGPEFRLPLPGQGFSVASAVPVGDSAREKSASHFPWDAGHLPPPRADSQGASQQGSRLSRARAGAASQPACHRLPLGRGLRGAGATAQ